MNNKLLEIVNLNKTYHTINNDVIALKNVSFDVYKNEFISIVGPSGCGKSTILSILSGLESKTSGDITLTPDTSIGYMLQDDCLFFWKTILDNCLVGLEINGCLNSESYDYVIYLLKTYGLYDFKDMYPSSLSGGMRQRVLRIRYTHK